MVFTVFLQSVSRVHTYKNNTLASFQIMMRTQRRSHLTVMRTQSLKQTLFLICFPVFEFGKKKEENMKLCQCKRN